GERGPAPCRGVSVAGESAVKRLYPLVRELAVDGIPVAVSCRVLKLSRQPYYRWLAAPVPEAEVNEAYRANALFDAHRDDPEFGYRYLADEAEAAGEPMAVRTAWRLCSDNAWFSAFGKARAKNGKSPAPCSRGPVRRYRCRWSGSARVPCHGRRRGVVDRHNRTLN